MTEATIAIDFGGEKGLPIEAFNAQTFLTDHGIESLGDRLVADHEGNLVPMAQAIVSCKAARSSIEAVAEMARENGLDAANRVGTFLDKQSRQALAEAAEAKKKAWPTCGPNP